jgi:nicotinamidase-related amidase
MPLLSPEEVAMPERIDRCRAALIAYDVCRRALTPSDPARRAVMRPVLDAWVQMIAAVRAAGVPVIYTTPVSRSDGADVVMLPTDLSAETGVPPLTNAIEDTAEAGFPDDIAPRPGDYVFLKRRPSAFYGTGVAELLHMLRRDTIIIGGGATNRGVETSVREAFNLDLASWCANTAGAAIRPPTPTASTRR